MKKVFMGLLLVCIIGAIIFILNKTNSNAAKSIQDSSASGEVADVDVVITDNYFIQATNDVYLNIDSFIGKTIKMEGLVYYYKDNRGENHVAVVRNSPGCCGNDGLAGLDIEYNECPEHGTWVEVIGTIKETNIDYQRVPIIEVTSMTRKPEGKTFVTN